LKHELPQKNPVRTIPIAELDANDHEQVPEVFTGGPDPRRIGSLVCQTHPSS
jgi:hypothetical protein